MRQALHIFREDTRHLWCEIGLALLVTVLFTVSEIRHAIEGVGKSGYLGRYLLPLAWWILIARVIHAEPLPGDRQFWLTRPYSRKSLLAAKALFILVWVNLPKLVADIVIVGAGAFSLRAELPGLLWSQVLLTAVFVLPMAALAAITTGTIVTIESLAHIRRDFVIPNLRLADFESR
jgi:hypothetical protein